MSIQNRIASTAAAVLILSIALIALIVIITGGSGAWTLLVGVLAFAGISSAWLVIFRLTRLY